MLSLFCVGWVQVLDAQVGEPLRAMLQDELNKVSHTQ